MLYIYTSPDSFAVAVCQKITNANGTVSAQRTTDQLYLSRDSTGAVKWQPSIGGDEQFTIVGKKLLSTNLFPDAAHATYVAFPFEEA
jgi:hypothetical protein